MLHAFLLVLLHLYNLLLNFLSFTHSYWVSGASRTFLSGLSLAIHVVCRQRIRILLGPACGRRLPALSGHTPSRRREASLLRTWSAATSLLACRSHINHHGLARSFLQEGQEQVVQLVHHQVLCIGRRYVVGGRHIRVCSTRHSRWKISEQPCLRAAST